MCLTLNDLQVSGILCYFWSFPCMGNIVEKLILADDVALNYECSPTAI